MIKEYNKNKIKNFVAEFLNDDSISVKEYLKGRLAELDDLTKRLQDDYAGDVKFEQQEEDRLCAYDLCEFLEKIIEEIENN